MKQMKLTLKKTLSLFLAVALMIPALALAGTAANKTPIVCVCGDGEILATKEDGTRYAPKAEYADELVSEAVPELVPVFAKALVTNNYDEWSEKALEALSPIYAPIKPNPDGTLPEGTGPDYSWSPENLHRENAAANYYAYWWDFRLSPLDVADDLNAYIEAVKAQNGADKVVLESRCAGVSVAAAYMDKYGTDSVEKVIFVCNSLHGFDYADLIFSGNVTVSGDALYRYLAEYETLGGLDDGISSFIFAMLKAMNKDASTDEIISLFFKLYDKIGPTFIAPFIREFYGISLGYVATVDEHFDDYVEYVFPTDALKAEYAYVIEKATAYHETIQNNIDDMLQEIDASGVPVYFIACYGEQQVPLGEMSDYQGDQMANLKDQSFGATSSKMTETLSDSYIAAQTEKGMGKYISPDKQVDASTCMFPDQTWFLKNLRHWFHGDDVLAVVDTIAHTDNITVDTLENFPQYLNAKEDHSGVDPAQAVNGNDIDWNAIAPAADGKTSFLAGVVAFFARIVAFFTRVIRFIKQAFGIVK